MFVLALHAVRVNICNNKNIQKFVIFIFVIAVEYEIILLPKFLELR